MVMASSKLEMLDKACAEFQLLDYQASDRDRSLAAFETFRRAVVCLRRSEVASERSAVDSIEPKSRILEFLLDFSGRYIPYRSRMAELLKSLQGCESWSTSMEADSEVHAGVHGVIHETKAVCTGPGVTKVVCKDLEKAAAVAKSEGDLGVLSVRVIAAHNLNVKSDSASKMCVSMSLGDRTSSSLPVRGSPEPRWNSEEFVFDVGVSDWLVKFNISNTIGEDVDYVGMLSVTLAEIISTRGPVTLCRSFDDVPDGALEFVLQYVSGGAAEPEASKPESVYEPTPASAARETPWSHAPAPAAPAQAAPTLTAQQMAKLWAIPVDAVPTPQRKTKPMLPVVSKTDSGATMEDSCQGIRDGITTKRAAADPWAVPKAPKTPKRESGATPSKRGVSPAPHVAKTPSNPFRTSASPRFQQKKTSNPFNGEKKESGVGKKLQKAFDNLWA